MPIYFIDENDISGDTARIKGDNFHHLSNVLRCRTGEEIFLSGGGEKIKAEIVSVTKKYIEAKITGREKIQQNNEITLIQCLPKKDKMDLVVRHNTELGARNIVPAISERSVPKPDGARSGRLLSRWKKISVEQAQQSGIAVLPEVSEIRKFDEAVSGLKGFDLVLIPWEEEKSKKIRDILKNCTNIKKIAIIIGPEGGLSEKEVQFAQKTGAVPVSLGNTILRTEIAGLVSLSIIKYHLGWM